MKTIKFRYADANGRPDYKEITLPDDAVQFVGLDLQGKEIYEGDVLTDFDEDEFEVRLVAMVRYFSFDKSLDWWHVPFNYVSNRSEIERKEATT